MTAVNKDKIDPGFWIGLILIAALLYFTYKCH